MAGEARPLVLSENTVTTRLRRISETLDVQNQRDALSLARLTGVLPGEAFDRDGG